MPRLLLHMFTAFAEMDWDIVGERVRVSVRAAKAQGTARGRPQPARATAASPVIEAGNAYLSHPQIAPWVAGFMEECAAFPIGAHDDQVNTITKDALASRHSRS